MIACFHTSSFCSDCIIWSARHESAPSRLSPQGAPIPSRACQSATQDEELQRAVANSTAGYAELTAMVRNTTLAGGERERGGRGSFDQAASPGCAPSSHAPLQAILEAHAISQAAQFTEEFSH